MGVKVGRCAARVVCARVIVGSAPPKRLAVRHASKKSALTIISSAKERRCEIEIILTFIKIERAATTLIVENKFYEWRCLTHLGVHRPHPKRAIARFVVAHEHNLISTLRVRDSGFIADRFRAGASGSGHALPFQWRAIFENAPTHYRRAIVAHTAMRRSLGQKFQTSIWVLGRLRRRRNACFSRWRHARGTRAAGQKFSGAARQQQSDCQKNAPKDKTRMVWHEQIYSTRSELYYHMIQYLHKSPCEFPKSAKFRKFASSILILTRY